MARGFSPRISARLQAAGYRLAADPLMSSGFPSDYPATAENPNYMVPDPGFESDHDDASKSLTIRHALTCQGCKSCGRTPPKKGNKGKAPEALGGPGVTGIRSLAAFGAPTGIPQHEGVSDLIGKALGVKDTKRIQASAAAHVGASKRESGDRNRKRTNAAIDNTIDKSLYAKTPEQKAKYAKKATKQFGRLNRQHERNRQLVKVMSPEASAMYFNSQENGDTHPVNTFIKSNKAGEAVRGKQPSNPNAPADPDFKHEELDGDAALAMAAKLGSGDNSSGVEDVAAHHVQADEYNDHHHKVDALRAKKTDSYMKAFKGGISAGLPFEAAREHALNHETHVSAKLAHDKALGKLQKIQGNLSAGAIGILDTHHGISLMGPDTQTEEPQGGPEAEAPLPKEEATDAQNALFNKMHNKVDYAVRVKTLTNQDKVLAQKASGVTVTPAHSARRDASGTIADANVDVKSITKRRASLAKALKDLLTKRKTEDTIDVDNKSKKAAAKLARITQSGTPEEIEKAKLDAEAEGIEPLSDTCGGVAKVKSESLSINNALAVVSDLYNEASMADYGKAQLQKTARDYPSRLAKQISKKAFEVDTQDYHSKAAVHLSAAARASEDPEDRKTLSNMSNAHHNRAHELRNKG